MDTDDQTVRKRSRIFLVAWLLIGLTAVLFLPLGAWLKALTGWILGLGWIGQIAYVFIYILFCIFLIPSSALSTLVAPAYGFQTGLILTVIASNLGGTVAFFLGRTVLRGRVERWAADKPRFKAVDEAVGRNGFSIVALVRMSPIFPFTICNYLLSLTRVPYWKYALGTFCGMLPMNAAFLYIGCELRNAVTALKVQSIVGIAMTIVALAVISRIAMKAVKAKDVS